MFFLILFLCWMESVGGDVAFLLSVVVCCCRLSVVWTATYQN